MRLTSPPGTVRFLGSLLVAFTLLSILAARESRSGDLERGFVDPPAAAKPRVYWWWLESNVSKAGITRDLEEMHAKGIGGALIFDAASLVKGTPSGPTFMSRAWRDVFQHAVAEADRLGLELSVNICSGWDSGGPWVPPEHASQKVVWSETVVEGPQTLQRPLPIPAAVPKDADGQPVFYRDIAVQAFPVVDSPPITMQIARPKITASSSQSSHPPNNVVDGKADTLWVSHGDRPGAGPSKENPEWLMFEFAKPFPAFSFFIVPQDGYGPRHCALQTSEDGENFKTVRRLSLSREGTKTIAFNQIRSRFFRLLITSAFCDRSIGNPWNVQIGEIALLQEREIHQRAKDIRYWRRKAGYKTGSLWVYPGACDVLLERNPEVPGEVDIASASLVDLSADMDVTGRLAWQVPKGKWCILRIGHTITGRKVQCASPGGGGYMLDFLSRAAMDLQFESVAKKLLDDVGDLAGKSLTGGDQTTVGVCPGPEPLSRQSILRHALRYFHDDSWEVGSPNWTVGFEEQFKRFRGYDILPYLPVLTGRIVDSRDISNRFLDDFRKTIGDCIAENHYAHFRELTHRYGVQYHAESGGPFYPNIDALKCLGRVDIPMTEFWQDGHWMDKEKKQNAVGKQAASAAHIYGKKYVNAEAFTSIGPHWQEDLFALKPVADRAFCEGINRFFQHTFSHSPLAAGKPGLEYFAGTHFNPQVTWWEQVPAWTDTISRCQFLLQEGRFVADVCFYYGDNVPNFAPPKHVDPALGPGYDYDTVNTEVILTRMSVEDGRIVLPDGMGYRLLALPPHEAMPLAVLRKLADLVKAGATVVGPRPMRAPGLSRYPDSDESVRTLAAALWGSCDGKTVKENRFGKGRVVWGRPLREILQADGVQPDFEFAHGRPDARLDWIHRTTGAADYYFVANLKRRWEDVQCTFRVAGRSPEIWEPDTGTIRKPMVYDQVDGRTVLPLRLAPYGSFFVVFRAPADQSRIVSLLYEGETVFPHLAGAATTHALPEVALRGEDAIELTAWDVGTYELANARGQKARVLVRAAPAPVEITGPWQVRFAKGWGAPESSQFEALTSWTENTDAGIKYFSGTASYLKEVEIPASLIKENRVFLDLGTVKNVAEVLLNGKKLGTLWKEPFRVEITAAVRPGTNRLEIKVTNLWPNRLIGDRFLPAKDRFTRTPVARYSKDSPLLDSGLLGPVRIFAACQVTIAMR